MNASWKTTSLGIATILAAVVNVLHAIGTGATINWAELIPAITAGWGLIHARDNNKTSEQVGAGTATTSFAGARLWLWLLVAIMPFGILAGSGCASGPQRVAYNTVAVPAITLDQAMTAWGDYVKKFPQDTSTKLKVKAAYEKAQAAELLAIDAAHMAANMMGSTNAPMANIKAQLASQVAGQAFTDLIGLIDSLGLQL